MTIIPHCKVKHCRYKFTHTTAGHMCGIVGCKNPYGHGQIEHGDEVAVDNLKKYLSEKLLEKDYCNLPGCKYPWSHKTESHYCYKCKRRGQHTSSNCIIQSLDNACEKWSGYLDKRKIEEFVTYKNNVFFGIYVGMGCYIYVSCVNNFINTLFMHSDAWGQYGPQTNDTPIYVKFCEGLDNVTLEWSNYNIENKITRAKCPVSRKNINNENIKYIKGLDSKCSICYENNIEVYFEECEHSVVCKDCLKRLIT